jgi:Mg-chelatase subunit ChlD
VGIVIKPNLKSAYKLFLFIGVALILLGNPIESKAAANKDVILVLDTSLSMVGYGGKNIFNDVKLSIYNYIDTLQDGDRVIFVTFDSESKTFPSVLVDDNNDRDILKKYISVVEAKGEWTYTLGMLKTVFTIADTLTREKGEDERNLAIVIMTDALDDPPPGKRKDQFDLTKIAEQYSGQDWWIYLVNLADLEKSDRVAAAQEELRKELLKVSEKTMIVDGSDPDKAMNEDIAQDIQKKEIMGSNIIPFVIAGFLALIVLILFLLKRLRDVKLSGQIEYWNHELIKPDVMSVDLGLYGAKVVTIGRGADAIVKISDFDSRNPVVLKALRADDSIKAAVSHGQESVVFKNRDSGEFLENGDIFTVENYSFRYLSE